MKIYKLPEYENDSYYFKIDVFDEIVPIAYDPYYEQKRKAFRERDISKGPFQDFLDRPSFTGINSQENISGTIYTRSAEYKNAMSYERIIALVKENHRKSRRCVVRIADSLHDYLDDKINTSCLAFIHYYKFDVHIVFRASDMKNELHYDLLLIKEFFIDPVFNQIPEINVFATTAQNIKTDITKFIKSNG